ncbi:hypothetical protein [Caldicellulosiruptor morganii]|uniref:Uncharacterized protein n=1 Tax=Caldicellulosiruptor morganii TaxID=1387555 RepID=A0ABY7BLZ2_9FIRM|nr:hypothetical protein [Caldicellulosiruptor morganii]WAM33829.1 hypothetical protein OTK00_002374 [Caldicellulosiruptor morganii]
MISQLKQVTLGETVVSNAYNISDYKYLWDKPKVVKTRTVSFQDPWRLIYSYKNDTPYTKTIEVTQQFQATNTYSVGGGVKKDFVEASLGVSFTNTVIRIYKSNEKVPAYKTFYLEAAGVGVNIYFDVYVPHPFDSGYDIYPGWVKNYTGIAFWAHF